MTAKGCCGGGDGSGSGSGNGSGKGDKYDAWKDEEKERISPAGVEDVTDTQLVDIRGGNFHDIPLITADIRFETRLT